MDDERKNSIDFGSNVKVNFSTLYIRPCGHNSNYSFAQSFLNFTCRLWMIRRGPLFILGHGVIGQVQLCPPARGCHALLCLVLLCRISQFPSQIQLCVIRICLCIGQHFTWMLPVAMTSGNILLERYPLLRRCSECRDVRHWFLDLNCTRIFFTESTFFSECYPPLYILCKNYVTIKIFKQTTDQWNYRKFRWGIII